MGPSQRPTPVARNCPPVGRRIPDAPCTRASILAFAAGLALWLQLGAGCGTTPPSGASGRDGNTSVDNANRAGGGGNVPASGGNVPQGATGGSAMVDNNGVVAPARTGAAALADGGVHADGPLVASGAAGLLVLPMAGCTVADYHVQLRVGGDTVSVIADSGSSSAAVAAGSCSNCGQADRYNTSSGTNLGKKLTSTYGSGEWNGLLFQDGMGLGPKASGTATVPMRFGAMTSQDRMLQPYSCRPNQPAQNDGILGLGPNTLLLDGTTSLLAQLNATKKFAYDAFAVQSCGVDGNLFLGGYDAAYVARQPFFVPMVTGARNFYAQYYSVNLAGLVVGDQTVAQQNTLGPAIVDNGTSLMYVPDAAHDAFRTALAQDENFAANFSIDRVELDFTPTLQGRSRAELDELLPKFGLTLVQADGTRATLWLDATSSYLLPGIDSEGGTQYLLAVQNGDHASGSGSLPLLIGNALMKQHIVIFDRAGKQVGFAPQVGCDATVAYLGQ